MTHTKDIFAGMEGAERAHHNAPPAPAAKKATRIHHPNAELAQKIRTYATFGLTRVEVCRCVGITPKVYQRHYTNDYTEGATVLPAKTIALLLQYLDKVQERLQAGTATPADGQLLATIRANQERDRQHREKLAAKNKYYKTLLAQRQAATDKAADVSYIATCEPMTAAELAAYGYCPEQAQEGA